MTDDSNVKRDGIGLLRRWANGERMPFEPRYLGYLYKHPVAGAEIKPSRPFYNQMCDPWRQYHTGANNSLAPPKEACQDPVGHFNNKDTGWPDKPFPELRRVHEEESPVEEVEHVGAVEHLEVAAASNYSQGSNEDDC